MAVEVVQCPSHPNAIVRLRINIVLPFTTTTKRVWQGRRPVTRDGERVS
jgi:hypothetical protein